MNDLETFLSSYLPASDLVPLIKSFTPRIVKKKRFFVSPGKICDTIAYVRKGSFRVYFYDVKGNEITTWFSFEGMVITDMLAFYTGNRSTFYVQAMEDAEVWVISRDKLEGLYKRYPIYSEFGRKFAEEALTMLMQRTLSLHVQTAEERYRDLLMKREFMEKIPLKYLASYLGITDTSLSRIRRKIK